MEDNRNLPLEIVKLFEENSDLKVLKELLSEYHPYDIAESIALLDDESRSKLHKIYTNEELAEIFSYISDEDTSEILEDISPKQIASIVNEMEPDDAVDMLQEMDDEEKFDDVLKLVDEDIRSDINSLSKYDDDTAGAIMTVNYVSVLSGSDIKLAMKNVVSLAPDVESFNTIFVVDEKGKLVGTIDLKKLIVSKSPCLVNDIMSQKFQFVNSTDSLDDVVKQIRDYDIYEMPVLEDGYLIGMITMDDAMDAFSEGNEDDYAKLSGLTEGEISQEGAMESVKKRIPWLAVLIVLNIFVSIIMALFTDTINSITILVLFQPLILGVAGNSGTQSLAVAVRKISNDELDTSKEVKNHLLKEMVTGLLQGIIVGVVTFVYTYLFLTISKNNDFPIPMISLVVAISVTVALSLANLFGALIPIIFYKIKIDPAVASGPFITTLNDILTVVIYFGLATLILFNFLP